MRKKTKQPQTPMSQIKGDDINLFFQNKLCLQVLMFNQEIYDLQRGNNRREMENKNSV